MLSVRLMRQNDQAWSGPQRTYNLAKKTVLHTEQLAQSWARLPFIKKEIQWKAWSMRISHGKYGPCAGLGEINEVSTQVWKIRICNLKSISLQSNACEMWRWDSVPFSCCLCKRHGMLSRFPISLPASIRQTTVTCVVSYETSHSCPPSSNAGYCWQQTKKWKRYTWTH